MKTATLLVTTVAVVVFPVLQTMSRAQGVPLANPGFEEPVLAAGATSPTLTGWTDAGTDSSKRFVERITGFTAEGSNHLVIRPGWRVWQTPPGLLYQPDTIYSLRAAAGHRSGVTTVGNVSRISLGVGGSPTSAAFSEFDARSLAPDTFGQMTAFYAAAGSGGFIGQPVGVRLEATLDHGTNHFDDVRLSTCGTFRGGDAGEGLDLQGDFAYAVNFGTNGAPGLIGGATFTTDAVAGVTLSAGTTTSDSWANPFYGTTASDTGLAQAMSSARLAPGGRMTITLGGLQAGLEHKLQLLFITTSSDRGFDVRVNGQTVFDEFRPRDFGGTGSPLRITHQFTPAGTTATIELDGTTATAGAVHEPAISALTLERGLRVRFISDAGAGSLRQALADAAASPGPDTITFDPSIFNGEALDQIALSSAELAVNDADGVTIDASAITGGVTLSGFWPRRVLNVAAGSKVTLKGLKLEKGYAAVGQSGAVVLNAGALTLEDCTISGGTAAGASGGGLHNNGGTLLMNRCTLSGNSAASGGALRNEGSATLTQCTVCGNFASSTGAGIHALGGTLTLTQCTVAANKTGAVSGGGGLTVESPAVVTLAQCIVAGNTVVGNTGTSGPDIQKISGTLTASGVNLIGRNDTVTAEFPAGTPNTSGSLVGSAAAPLDARLSSLRDHGGPTSTMVPLVGSPAMDRLAATSFATDQRGLPRVLWGRADLGAVEAGVTADCAWEVRDVFLQASPLLNSLADADALASNPAATSITSTQAVINFADPATDPDGGGFFFGDTPYASDNLTPSGLVNGDDSDFVTVARAFVKIDIEDDYTLGFSSDDGARLRVFGATFTSSTRLNNANPSNPAHSGDTLKFDDLTDNSATLGVCHLTPGVWPVEFLTWERGYGAHAEVIIALGARTQVDAAFQLLGGVFQNPGHGMLSPAGWSVDVSRNGAADLADAIAQMDTEWCSTLPLAALRFTSANDFPERDPVTFTLEGSQGTEAGPWVMLASGSTGFTIHDEESGLPDSPIARETAAPAIPLDTPVLYRFYRVLFPEIRDAATANSMQIAGVAFLDAKGRAVVRNSLSIYPTSTHSPTGETADKAMDGITSTKYLNFDKLNTGFAVRRDFPSQSAGFTTITSPTINFRDPQSGGGGHGQPQADYPGNLPGDDDHFALGARARLSITTGGWYTFCLLGDDSARLLVKGSRGWYVSGGASPQALLGGFPDHRVLQ